MVIAGVVTGSMSDILTGQLTLRGGDGTVMTRRDLTRDSFAQRPEEGIYAATIHAEAPMEPGCYDGILSLDRAGEEADLTIAFQLDVRPHPVSVLVWEVPDVVQVGSKASIKIGLKCEAGCDLSDWEVDVLDGDGTLLASAVVSDMPWPGTASLHYTSLSLTAPATPAMVPLKVQAHASQARAVQARDQSAGPPHTDATALFNLRVVPAAEHVIAVDAIDRRSGNPVENARVVAHPYRTRTDQNGYAALQVPTGVYTIFVSGPDHIPVRFREEITGAAAIRAELDLDEGLSDADLW